MGIRPHLLKALLFAAFVAGLMWVAIWNGYPTFYPDSATYIECGFLLETPVDRPITYGLLLRLTSLEGVSLWAVVLFQGALVAVTMFAFIRLFAPRFELPIAMAVCGLTGVSFLGSQVMTDVYTPLMIMSLVLYGLAERLWSGWLGLFVLALAMHASHLALAVCMVPLLLIILWKTGLQARKALIGKSWRLLLGTGVAYVALNISMVKSTEAFYAAHLAETGDLQAFLKRACAESDYELCSHSQEVPKSAEIFLWDSTGTSHSYASRERMRADLQRIIGDMFADDDARKGIIRTTLQFGTRQLSHFEAGEGNVPFRPGSTVHRRIVRYFPAEVGLFEQMKQNTPGVFGQLVSNLNTFYWWVTVAALVLMVPVVVSVYRRNGPLFPAIALFIVLSYVANCFINAGMVVVAHRFGAKLIWMLPLMVLTGLVLCLSKPHGGAVALSRAGVNDPAEG